MRQPVIKLVLFCMVFVFSWGVVSGQQDFSLDDNPSPPWGPWGLNAPPVAPYLSAEDEFGLGLTGSMAGFIGPSPTLQSGFSDADILGPGPVISMVFPPPPHYMDCFCADHGAYTQDQYQKIWLRFSIDRATGGYQPWDQTYQQASNHEQCGDIFMELTAFSHPGNFIPLPFATVYGGALATAGTGLLAPNARAYDESFFGLIPQVRFTPYQPGSHDNIDGYNDLPPGAISNYNIFFALHPASAFSYIIQGILVSAADIFISPAGGLNFNTTPYATASQVGLDFLGLNTDSIDALVLWDYGTPGACDPGVDYALFSLAPGSQTLTALWNLGFPVSAGSVFLTDFQGYFYQYAYPTDLGVGPYPTPVLPGVSWLEVNIDALEITVRDESNEIPPVITE